MQDGKVSDSILTGMVAQKDDYEDKRLAHKILLALCDSSISDEMDYYKHAVQEDLGLDDQTMDRMFNLATIARLLEPEMPKPRYYRGKLVPKKDSKTTWNHMINIILNRNTLPEMMSKETETESVQDQVLDRSDPVPISDVEQPDLFQSEEVLRTVEEPEKNKHPAAKALRKLLRDQNVQIDGMKIDTERYEKSLILMGNTKPFKDFLKSIGGKWSARSGVWQFSKDNLVSRVE